MTEGNSEKLSRSDLLKTTFWGTLAAIGLSQAPRAMRAAEEYRWDPTRPENLKAIFGTETPLLLNLKDKVRLGEGDSLYKEPRVEKPPEQGIITVPTTGNTLLGTLRRGEEIIAEDPFLFLEEADTLTPEEKVITFNYQGESKRLDSRGWIAFNIKGSTLPESVRGDSPYGIACAQIEARPENITVSQEINFGRVIS